MSAVSGNAPPTQPHVHLTKASSYASPVQSSHPTVPVHLDHIEQPILLEQQVIEVHVEHLVDVVLPDVDIRPLVEEISDVPVVAKLKPPARPITLSRLSLFPKIFQHMHDFGLF